MVPFYLLIELNSEGYLIRKGPGVCHFDFAQEISFGPQPKAPQPTAVKAEPMQMRSDKLYSPIY
jgi:hypothetical protein